MGFLETYGQLHTPEDENALLLEWIIQHRHDLFSELRQAKPIFEAPNCFIVSRYDDVKEVLTDKDFSVEPYRQGGGGTFVLGMDDGPERALRITPRSPMTATNVDCWVCSSA